MPVEIKTNYYDEIKSMTGTKTQLVSLRNIASSRPIDKKEPHTLNSRTNNDIIFSQKAKQIYSDNKSKYATDQRASHEQIINHVNIVKLKQQCEFSSGFDQLTFGTCTDVNSTSALRRVSHIASSRVPTVYQNQPVRSTNGLASASKDQYKNSFKNKPKPFNNTKKRIFEKK